MAVAMVVAGVLVRSQIDAPPPAPETPETVGPHPLIRSAAARLPGESCIELWWDGASIDDGSDDGWVYAWGTADELVGWMGSGMTRACGAGVPGGRP